MVSHSPALGSTLRSVALRYQPRARSAWPHEAARRPRVTSPLRRGEVSPPAAGPCRRDRATAAVEAVLMLANEPVSGRRLCQLAELADPTQARTLVRRLNEYYVREEGPFRIEEVAGGWQMLTHPSFGGWLRRLHPSNIGIRLSVPALETLAVVAYRQPVVRAEVESIRGVQCGEMLRQLMDRDLVRIVGKSPDLGRPFLYGTTPRFLQVFGLRHLDDLPRAGQLRQAPPAATAGTHHEVIPGPRRDQDLLELPPVLKEEQHT